MTDTVVYDNTSATAAGEIPISIGAAFSFTTAGSASGSLVDVKLELRDSTATTDGGSVSVTLYNNAAGMDQPGAQIATLGTIQDSQLNANGTGTLVDIPLAASATLQPGTRYWVQLNQTSNSGTDFNFESGDSGTGVAGESFYLNGEPNSDPNSEGAFIGSVTEDVACFVSGTMIATTRGAIAVERLKVGDRVVTASGRARPIVWIGHRDVDCASPAAASASRPVRVRAGAFGDSLPARDLFLSPGHPVLVGADADNEGGHLVPIMCLINGTTIVQVAADAVTYWHVELDAHDILLAEGLPAESYFDLGSRPWFGGADGALYDPDFAPPGAPGRCRPVAIDGPLVDAERRRLDTLFEMNLVAQCGWPSEEAPVLDV